MHESGMDDTDSINVDITPPPVQIHQLAAFLWNILNNDREANMVILERLEDTDDDPSRHPVQIFSASDLVHLASDLAESSRTFVERSTSHGDQCSNLPEPRVPKLEHIFGGQRPLSFGGSYLDSRVDQQRFEPPPAVCQRCQDQRHTN